MVSPCSSSSRQMAHSPASFIRTSSARHTHDPSMRGARVHVGDASDVGHERADAVEAAGTFNASRNLWAAAGLAGYWIYFTDREERQDPGGQRTGQPIHTRADRNGATVPGSSRHLFQTCTQRLCNPSPGRYTLTCDHPNLQPVRSHALSTAQLFQTWSGAKVDLGKHHLRITCSQTQNH